MILKSVFPILQKECSGCGACAERCPTKAISISQNKIGFREPLLDKSKCVECGLCRKTCPLLSPMDLNMPLASYACWHKNEAIREESATAGVFSAIAQIVLEKNGVVFGAKWDNQMNVIHDYVDAAHGKLTELRGSKYIESNLIDCYAQVKTFLEQGRIVLFSGTPCQIAGLYRALGKPYEFLVTLDLICHGVPSPFLFHAYKNFYECKYDSMLIGINLRKKDPSWGNFSCERIFKCGLTNNSLAKKDFFYTTFLNPNALRESCHFCAFSQRKRIANFSLADYWNIEKVHSDIKSTKGVGVLLVNKEHSIVSTESILEKLHSIKTPLESIVRGNARLSSPSLFEGDVNAFYQDLKRMPYIQFFKKHSTFFSHKSQLKRLRRRTIYLFQKLFGKF